MPFSTKNFTASANDDRISESQLSLPWAISADSPIWTHTDDPVTLDLAKQFVELQSENDLRMFSALNDLVETMSKIAPAGTQAPPQVFGRIDQPDGSPAGHVQVSLISDAVTTADARLASAITAEDGTFVLPIPQSARSTASVSGLSITSGDGVRSLSNALKDLQPSGALPPIRLPQPVTPLPIGVIAALQAVVDAAGTGSAADTHATPALAIGEDDCQIVFAKDQSMDRFPYGVLFRLTDPALSQPSLRFAFDNDRANLSYYGPYSPAAALTGLDQLRFRLTQRVPVDRPISIDAFRDGIAADRPFGGVPIAGSLAIGYVVKLAQRWTPLGLALGDLVYSLPLAPGEQQRIAVEERTASSSVIETERLDSSEQVSFAEADDTSATSTFASAFNEVASGGSHYDTEASSFSVAAAAGGGGVFPFGCAAGGVATSFGTSSSDGNTATWMSGARNSTSDVAERTHSSVNRQAAARRSSSRTAMRLATASETDQIVTKVITNHNKTRALTMQYWEVQRLFDVTSVTEGVNLVCMIPMDVIRFLPSGQPAQFDAAPTTRSDVLARYGRMLAHADILARVVPVRYRRGLTLISDFAADPTSTVATSSAPAEDIVNVSLTATIMPFEDLYVTVVGKRGMRVGPLQLTGVSNVSLPDGKNAYASEDILLGKLREARAGTDSTFNASISMPPSFARQDIVGFEISRRFRRLDYKFAPQLAVDLGTAAEILGGPLVGLAEGIVNGLTSTPSKTVSYASDRLEKELGGPRTHGFSATISGSPQLASLPGWGTELPTGAYPIAARTVPPILSYSSLLEIEKTLQWVMRNTMTCSVATYASITPEERTVMLERYEITLPPDDNGDPRSPVPLLSCITNNVLGYYGNSMVMPFQIPAEMTVAMGLNEDGTPKLTTASIQDALTRFHTDGFDGPRSTIALPTKGVLGEAVLGHCASAEKIDLTRFWNWQDSPSDEATAISPVSMPTGSLTAGLTASNALGALTPQIQNFTMNPVTADTSLASALVSAASQQKDFDVSALTNAGNLATLTGKTLDTAESARKDAMASATQLAVKAMETSASIYNGGDKKGSGDSSDKKDKKDKKDDKPKKDDPDPVAGPATASIHFKLDSSSLTEPPASTELMTLTVTATAAKAAKATGAVVRGYASPEGTAAHNVTLAHDRAAAVVAHLGTLGITATTAEGGVLAGSPGDYPALRRADVQFQY